MEERKAEGREGGKQIFGRKALATATMVSVRVVTQRETLE